MIEWVEQLRAGFAAEFGTGPKVVTLATVDDRRRPRARSVVVRAIHDDGGLLIASDVRSQMTSHVVEWRRAEICAWLPAQRQQFRMTGLAGLITDTEAIRPAQSPVAQEWREQIWSELSESAKAMFYWPEPGRPRVEDSAAFPQSVRTGLPPASFCLIYMSPEEVDVLDLTASPHDRKSWGKRDDQWSCAPINP